MYLVEMNRERIIQKIKPLLVAPMIRTSLYSGNRYISSICLFHGDEWIGGFDSEREARAEMDRINNSTDEIVFVGGYQGQDAGLVRQLNAELWRYLYADR